MAVSNDRTLDLDRDSLIAWYLRNRERSRRLFDLIDADVYYTRPIALRNPIVFYEGHLPAFSIISFLKRGLGRPGVDGRLEQLFARGIDPDTVDAPFHAVERRPSGRSGRRCWRSAVQRTMRSWQRSGCAVCGGSAGDAAWRGHLHRARARGDAPGDAALHVAPPAARAQASARRSDLRARRHSRRPARPCGFPPGTPRSARTARRGVRLGQRVRRAAGRRFRPSTSTSTT